MYIDDVVMTAIKVARTDINTGLSMLEVKKLPDEVDKINSAEVFFTEARNLLDLLIRANNN